jgi:predicted membrane channel-forming protein YqfA (hemolysin III family)
VSDVAFVTLSTLVIVVAIAALVMIRLRRVPAPRQLLPLAGVVVATLAVLTGLELLPSRPQAVATAAIGLALSAGLILYAVRARESLPAGQLRTLAVVALVGFAFVILNFVDALRK